MQLNPKFFSTTDVVQQFYVFYNKETGHVLDLLRTVREATDTEDFITVPIDNELVMGVMLNTLSITQLLVAFDKDTNTRKLFKKDQYLRRVQEDNNTLYKIAQVKETDPAKQLTVLLYKTGKAEVVINRNSLDSFVSLVNDNNDAYKGFETLKFYVVSDRDPNKLYANINVDTAELIRKGIVAIDLPWFNDSISNKIVVYTKRVFSTYQVATLDQFIQTPEKENNMSMQYMSDVSEQDDCHISIDIKYNAVEVNSRIIDPIKFKIFDELQLHVVKKNDPNQYIRTITLTLDQIKNKGKVLLDSVLDDSMAVIHDNPSIKINLRTVNESTDDRV